MKTYEPSAGESIETTAQNMVQMATLFSEVVTAAFNDIPLDAAPNGDPKAIAEGYMTEMQRRSDEYRASPEYAARQMFTESDRMLTTMRADRDAYRIRATKAEQEVAEWKRRFDALLKITPEHKE